MQNNFIIVDIYFIVLSTQVENNIVSILSTQVDSVMLPKMNVSHDSLSVLSDAISNTLLEYLPIDDSLLSAQIITLHTNLIASEKENTLNVIYGCLVDENIQIKNSYWIPINYMDSSDPYARLTIEAMQRIS